jgi:hypothetical protein
MYRLSLIIGLILLVCGAAHSEMSFTDVTYTLDNQVSDVTTVAWGDVNNDGFPDLFVAGDGEESTALYENLNGLFVNVSQNYLLHPMPHARQAQFIDYDGDGLLDLFVLVDDHRGFRLLRQTPDHTFEPVTISHTLDFGTTPVQSAVWSDLNGDGRLDLMLSTGGTRQAELAVFQQAGGEFAAMRDNPFQAHLDGVGVISIMDYDRDGNLDVFLGSGSAQFLPRMYRYVNGSYEDWADRFGFPDKLGLQSACWLDYNNDQKFDLFVPGRENCTGMFKGAIVDGIVGLQPVTDCPALERFGSDAIFACPVDANMDGWTDLFTVRAGGLGCALVINNGGTSWEDVAPLLHINNLHRTNLAAAWGDFNNDGTPDLAIAQGANGVKLYQNDSPIHHEWYKLQLLSRDSHAPLYNCNVSMEFQHCKQIATSTPVTTGAGWSDPTITLVNTATRKSHSGELKIRWPNGVNRVYQLTDLHRFEVNTLYEPASPIEPSQLSYLTAPATPPRVDVSPNPFNPTTSLTFDLKEAATVDLRIYNLMGQEVATLAKGEYAVGSHRVTFDGRDLPSGLYFSKLTAGNSTTMARLMLLK